MSGFIYNGKNTRTILQSSALILCTFDAVDTVTGSSRENVVGEATISRSIANEFGTQYNPLSFQYALIKENGDIITDNEQRIIERWLTSAKMSKDLQIIDCSGNITCTYCGKFLSTEWVPMGRGWAGVKFSFQNNSAYPKKHFSKTYTITNSGTISINCESDEYEEYVYPTLTIVEPNETANVTIKNVTDNNNTMNIKLYQNMAIIIDCLHCISKYRDTNDIVSFSTLGWQDVGNIYWLRLKPGINELQIIGNVQITINYDYPYKRIGGWL